MEIHDFLKRVRFEFYLYSLVALLVTLMVTGALYSYHSRLIEQQNSLQRVNQLLSKQLQSVVLISDLAQRINAVEDTLALRALRGRMSSELGVLREMNQVFHQELALLENAKLVSDLRSLGEGEELDSKISEFLSRYEGIENVEPRELLDFKFELSTLSNLAYRELFSIISRADNYLRTEQAEYQSRIKNIGNYLI